MNAINAMTIPFSDTEESEAESPMHNSEQSKALVEDDEGENRQPIPNEVETERPIFSSYLKKKGEQRRNWKKRWFVLRATKISYYQDAKEYEILNMIPLSKIHACSVISLVKRKWVFGIVTKSRTFYLQAKDEDDMINWIDHIRAAVLKSFPNGDERGILSVSLMATTSPRLSAVTNTPISPLTLSAGDSNPPISSCQVTEGSPSSLSTAGNRVSFSDERKVAGESSIRASVSSPISIHPNTAKQIQDIKSLVNPSPLSQSWAEDYGGSDSDDEEITSPGGLNNITDFLADDKFKPKIYNIVDNVIPADTPLIQGYLYKLKINLGGVKNWKKYWFVVRNGKLTSYKNEQEYEVKRIISMSSAIAALAIDPVHGKEYSFKLVFAKKDMLLACKDGQSKQDWIKVLQDCISLYNNQQSI